MSGSDGGLIRKDRAESAHDVAPGDPVETRAATLDAEKVAAAQELHRAAATVGQARRVAAPKLAAKVAGHLHELAMAKARIEITVGSDPGDEVTFLLGANAGEPALPLYSALIACVPGARLDVRKPATPLTTTTSAAMG